MKKHQIKILKKELVLIASLMFEQLLLSVARVEWWKRSSLAGKKTKKKYRKVLSCRSSLPHSNFVFLSEMGSGKPLSSIEQSIIYESRRSHIPNLSDVIKDT